MKVEELKQMDFEPACMAWLATRKPFIRTKTHDEYKSQIERLARLKFAKFKLTEIDGDLIREYQLERSQHKMKDRWGRNRNGWNIDAYVGANTINKECGLLCQILYRVGIPVPDYQPLPHEEAEVGRALLDEERMRLFRLAASRPEWEGLYAFMLLSVNTSAGPKELFTLRLRDCNVEAAEISILGGGRNRGPQGNLLGLKNKHRKRELPLNDEALGGLLIALARAKRLGSTQPDHFLFPSFVRNTRKYDPAKRQQQFYHSWYALRRAAGLPTLRLYDLRHHFITELSEDNLTEDRTIEKIAGHRTARMKEKYSHIRMKHKRDAVDRVLKRRAGSIDKKPPQSVDVEPGTAQHLMIQQMQLQTQLMEKLTQMLPAK